MSKRNVTPSENKLLPKSKVGRPTAIVLLLLIFAVFLIGFGVIRTLYDGDQFRRRTIGFGPISGTMLVARISSLGEQRGTCGGVPEPVNLIRLNEPLLIASVVVCPGLMDKDEVRVLRSADTANVFDALSVALAASDDSSWRTPWRTTNCQRSVTLVGAFTVQIEGHEMRLALPIGVCGSEKATALAALNSVISIAGK